MAKKSTGYDDDDDEAEDKVADKKKAAEAPVAPEATAEAPVGTQHIKGNLSAMSVTVTTADDISKITEGMGVAGDGIAPGTTVVRTGPGAIVLTQSATQTATDVELSIG